MPFKLFCRCEAERSFATRACQVGLQTKRLGAHEYWTVRRHFRPHPPRASGAGASRAEALHLAAFFRAAGIPPHKQSQPLSAFAHRYAMIALATAQEKTLRPRCLKRSGSRPGEAGKARRVQQIRTTHRYGQAVQAVVQKADRLFLLIGIDAFDEIAKWHKAEDLFRECEFIVAGRPGYSLPTLPTRCREPAATAGSYSSIHKQAATRLGFEGVTSICWTRFTSRFPHDNSRNRGSGKPLGRFLEPRRGLH